MSDDDQKPRVFQLGTVPPPAGESDAYNAPTKVGPMAAQIQELINAATEEAERKSAQAQPSTTAPPPLPGATTTAPPPLASTTAPPPLATTTAPPPLATADRAPFEEEEEEEEEAPLSSNVPDEAGDTRIADGAYAILADIPTAPRATPPRPARAAVVAPVPTPTTASSVSEVPTPLVSVPPSAISEAPTPLVSVPPSASAVPSAPPAAIEINEPLPAFDDVKPEPAPLALESTPAAYSDPIAHTRPEWSSVSKSEPKIPVAAPARGRMALLIALLVVVFGIAGVAFLVFGHR